MTFTKLVSLTDKISFIESVFGKGDLSRDSSNFAVRCPLCDPRDANKKKLLIRLEDYANHCWSCPWKARSLLFLVKKFGRQSDVQRYVQIRASEGVELKDNNSQKTYGFQAIIKPQPKWNNATSESAFLLWITSRRGETKSDGRCFR